MKSIVLMLALLVSCKENSRNIALKGSWYYEETSWGDSTRDYVELYFGDTTYYAQAVTFGTLHDRAFKVTSDSLFYGETSRDLLPFYKIIKLKGDTLWLQANQRLLKRGDTIYYVKFPKGEFGHYDLTWTSENRDSLNQKIVSDFTRRMLKYWAIKTGDMREYDSLTKAGYWEWTMKEIREEEEREKEYLKRSH